MMGLHSLVNNMMSKLMRSDRHLLTAILQRYLDVRLLDDAKLLEMLNSNGMNQTCTLLH